MIEFTNSYSELPADFYSREVPEALPEPGIIAVNHELAENVLGLNLRDLSDKELALLFTGQKLSDSGIPLSLAYAGHQFGHFVPQLGDGRAILLGEIVAPDGKLYDVHLKGSGRTQFSRGGDGKSAIGPVIREYIVSEAMASLGIPTTCALAAATTGEKVYRESELPGGIFTRVARSHIRIGTFQYFAVRGQFENVKLLVDYVIQRHFPELKDKEDRIILFFKRVAKAQASMVATWMSVGFVHGVMNTDNMSIIGETLDYGPCAFIDNFAADRVFSSIDHYGRYAYNQQINIAKWNLVRLAESILPLVHEDIEKAKAIMNKTIEEVFPLYEEFFHAAMIRKFGLLSPDGSDPLLINSFFDYLEKGDLDFTQASRKLSTDILALDEKVNEHPFFTLWQKRLRQQGKSIEISIQLMNKVNPVRIPRNHFVENAIKSAEKGDVSVFKELHEGLKDPYSDNSTLNTFTIPPLPEERKKETFCGT